MFLFSLETWLLIALFLVLFYIYGTWPFSYWKSRGIEYTKTYPFIGNMYTVFQNKGLNELIIDGYESQKDKKYWGGFFGRKPELFVYDVDMLKQILLNDATHFQNRLKMLSGEPLDKNVLALDDDHWKHVRSYLSPTFSTVKLKMMTPIVQHCCRTVVDLLNEKSKDPETKQKGMDMRNFISNFTMDVTGRAFFGLDVDSQRNPENDFAKNCKKVMDQSAFSPLLLIGIFFPFIPKLLAKINLKPSFMDKETARYFKSIIFQAFEDRKMENSSNGQDFLQNMIKAEVNENEADRVDNQGFKWSTKGLLKDEILANAIVFIIAGFNTSSDVMSFTLKNLAAHPDCQEKVYQEIMEVMTDEALDYENVSKLVYLDMVINETMRLYPATPRVDRVCGKNTVVGDVLIEEDVVVVVPIAAVHMNEELWPEPYKFDPERFSPENRPNIHPCAFLPFGVGPRHCVAMRFALIEVKLALAYIIKHFKFSNAPDTPDRIKFNIMSRPFPFNLKFEPRK